jgi:SAM-dependent methyltransferase
MKPFIRFSKESDYLYQEQEYKRHLFWDFDDTLQGVMLSLLKALATPEEIALLCANRWRVNLEQLVEGSRAKLDSSMEKGELLKSDYTARDEFIFSRVEPESQFLYLGCGSGTECLRYAEKGYRVVGIDTVFELVDVAEDWAEYSGRSFFPICMDAFDLGFLANSFDGLLLEFYGAQPSLDQVLSLQQGVARVLSDSGRGIIVAGRKAYASSWYRMGSTYPIPMTRWLSRQSRLDFYFSERDGFEERLEYGLYRRSHTKESLSLELSYAFDVQECVYEKFDSRYVLCVVKPKKQVDHGVLSDAHFADYSIEGELLDIRIRDIRDLLDGIEFICKILKSHEDRVVEYYDERSFLDKSPLIAVETDLPKMIDLIEHILERCWGKLPDWV